MLKEMKSPPLQFLLPNGEVDPKALHVIRDVVQEDLAVADAEESASDEPPVPSLRGADRLREVAPLAAPEPSPKRERKTRSFNAGQIFAYRPKLLHFVVLGFVLAVVFAPWVVFGTFVAALFLFTGALVYFGTDTVWQRILHVTRSLAKKYPRKAVPLRRKYMTVSTRWNALLDATPEGVFDGLYLPDVRKMAQAELRYRIALDRRFAALRKDDAATWQ